VTRSGNLLCIASTHLVQQFRTVPSDMWREIEVAQGLTDTMQEVEIGSNKSVPWVWKRMVAYLIYYVDKALSASS